MTTLATAALDLPVVNQLVRVRGRHYQHDISGFKGDPAKQLSGLIVQRLRWLADQRQANGVELHAKVAVFDGTTAFITSANLTERRAGHNLEAGVLIRGADIPTRLVEHVHELRREGRLTLI